MRNYMVNVILDDDRCISLSLSTVYGIADATNYAISDIILNLFRE